MVIIRPSACHVAWRFIHHLHVLGQRGRGGGGRVGFGCGRVGGLRARGGGLHFQRDQTVILKIFHE